MTPHTIGATDLPEALRLAAELDHGYPLVEDAQAAAAELRRLHALAAGQAVAPATQPAVLSRGVIRDIFMAHGFTVKEGQTDLKEYVYAAAYALLDAARHAPPAMDGEVARLREALTVAVDHIDMEGLRISHCKDAALIDAARAAQKEGEKS